MLSPRDEHELSWFMRCAWHRLAGAEEPEYDTKADYGAGRYRLPDMDVLYKENWSDEFEALMRNRLLLGAFRYGLFRDQARQGVHYDSMASAMRHIERYLCTGNQEHLVDVANLCLVEFVRPSRPAHFAPIDDGDHHAERTR